MPRCCHRCEIDVAESKSLTAQLDAQHPTVRGQLPDHVLKFIDNPPGASDLPGYSTKSATEGQEAATVELSKAEREKQVGKAAEVSAQHGLATKMKYATDRHVIVVSKTKVALMDPRVEPSRELKKVLTRVHADPVVGGGMRNHPGLVQSDRRELVVESRHCRPPRPLGGSGSQRSS